MSVVMQMLMARLQNQNPQAYQFINQAINNNGDPNAVLNQMMKNATPDQKQNLITQAKNYRMS